MARLITFCVLLFVSSGAVAEIFRWTDDNQEVQYTETPPANRPYESVGNSTRPSADAAATESRLARQREALEQVRAEAQAQEKQRALDKQLQARSKHDQESCERATHNLETLQSHTQILIKDPNTGAQTRLDNEQREAQIRQSMKDIQYYCES
jgi:predicted ATP-binding protein involved in virulence